MIWLDRLSAAILFVLGCIHNFVAAPALSDVLDTRVLWFVTGGMSLWFAAIINFLWLRAGSDRLSAALSMAANSVLVAFAVTFIIVTQSFADPQNLALLLPALWLWARTMAATFASKTRT